MRLLKVCLIVASVLGCEALFGVEITPNIPEATTITNACVKLVTVSQQIISAVNSIRDLSYATLQLQNGGELLVTSVPQNYTALVTIANALNRATAATSGNLTALFESVQAPLAAFGDAPAEARFGAWLRLLNPATVPDFANLTLTLTATSTFVANVLAPAMKQFGAVRISQATFYNGVPKEQIGTFAQGLAGLASHQEMIVLPFINSAVSGFRMVSEKQTQFLSSADQAFQSADGALTSVYARFTELRKMFHSVSVEMLNTIGASVSQFTRRLGEFTDLYLGGSASDYTRETMFVAYQRNVTEQTRIVEVRIEQARNDATDNPLASLGSALQLGSSAVTQSLHKVLLRASEGPKVACIGQALNRFTNDYSNLLRNAFSACVSGSEYDSASPTTAAMNALKDVQNDVLQYFQQLNNVISGLSNSSPASARIQADRLLTAYFSQTFDIMDTIMQQLVNMATDLDVGYDLLIGRSRYCLAMNVAVAERMSLDLSIAVDAC
uniref:Secreted protein n=1 Tax=Anopheles atroparvus TaxID=41427 RepID=A0AAG5DW15_ANOAO